MSVLWNMWHGCTKYSEGCANCYVYRGDGARGRDASVVNKTASFDLIVKRGRDGQYKVKSGEVVDMCFSSDFLLDTADEWRKDIYAMMRLRSDLRYFFITKRILRFGSVMPDDWGEGWDNVCIGCTCENERRLNERMPCFLELPIKHRVLILEPMLSQIDVRPYIKSGLIEEVIAGGESGENARPVDYDWIKDVMRACKENNVTFIFKQTGAKFVKDGVTYNVERRFQHSQAKRAGINFAGKRYPELW